MKKTGSPEMRSYMLQDSSIENTAPDKDKTDSALSPYAHIDNGQPEEKKVLSTNFQVYMNTAKLFFGNAYLSIPNTFMFAGVIGGILMFGFVGALNCYTMLTILKCADRHPSVGTYSKLSYKVFSQRGYGKQGKLVVDISIWIMQLSVCISYLYFIGKQISQIVKHETTFQVDQWFYILLMTIPAMSICWFETYTFLSYFSIAGIFVAVVGMISIFGFCIHLFAVGEAVYTPINYFDFSGMVGHIGVAMFVFEGNAVIMNVRNEAMHKDAYPTVLKLAVLSTEVLFMAFATLCYLTYRDCTQDIFTLTLPIQPFTIFIRVCTCFNAMCSYPVQILAAFEIYENMEWFHQGSKNVQKAKRVVIRSIIVWIITGISLIIPNFTDFLNIAGSIGSAAIAFILPPILYMCEFKGELKKWVIAFNWFIVLFGFAGAIYSTYFSIDQIINPRPPPPLPPYQDMY